MEQEKSAQPSWREFEAQLVARTWEDAAFKQELLRDPTGVVEREWRKLGGQLPATLQVKVLEQPEDTLYIVLPEEPALSETQLNISGGSQCIDCGNCDRSR